MDIDTNVLEPFFSIIIPIYNSQRYLNRCIKSIKKQCYENYEVILVDDGSTDNSSKICQKYASDDIRYRYIRTNNNGSFKARRIGISNSKGQYLMFVDSDDCLYKNDVLLTLFNSLNKEEVAVIQFSHIKQYKHFSRKASVVQSELRVGKEDFKNKEYPYLICSMYENSHLTTCLWNKVYDRELFAHLPEFDNEGRIFMGDDQILNLFLLENCPSIKFIPDALYCHQEGYGGSNKFSKTTMNDLDAIKRYQLYFLDRYKYADYEKIEKQLFAESAAWLYGYVQQSINYLNDTEVISMIDSILELPTFKLARNYYLNKSTENWEAVDLLRKAKSTQYLQSAKKYVRDHFFELKLKKSLRDFLLKII